MNTKKLLLSCLSVIGIGAMTFGQAFERIVHTPGIDHNHYSIESMPDGGYAAAGTQFDPSTGNNDIHVFVMDQNGNMVWERVIDISHDDRALDMAIGINCDIVVTGYVKDAPLEELYVVSFDGGGTFLGDYKLPFTGGYATAGTNIIFNQTTNTYVVGGLETTALTTPVISNQAIVLELNSGTLTPTGNSTKFVGNTDSHTSINDIVVIPDGYFLTGSVNPNGPTQGVMAAVIDNGFNVINDISFHSTNTRHIGVSAVYDEAVDNIYLLSNNADKKNPQMTVINSPMGAISIVNQYLLEIDPTYGTHNAAGFHLKANPWDSHNLVAMGYYQNDWPGSGAPNNETTLWIADFEKNTGAYTQGLVWPAPATNFALHGGGVFSTFTGTQPYIFNQEIFAYRSDFNGFVFITPNDMTGNYSVEVAATNMTMPGTCFEEIYFDNPSMGTTSTPNNPNTLATPSVNPYYPDHVYGSEEDYYCTPDPCFVVNSSTVGCDQAGELFKEASLNIDGVTAELFEVSPNPFNDNVNINLTGVNLNGELLLTNSVGQIVYRSNTISGSQFNTVISTESYESGIYILSYTSGDKLLVKKLIKM